jgi:hypothetical protein
MVTLPIGDASPEIRCDVQINGIPLPKTTGLTKIRYSSFKLLLFSYSYKAFGLCEGEAF